MPTFTFPDGRTVSLRPMYVLDELAFDDLATLGEALETERARFPAVQAQLQSAVTDEERAAALEAATDAVAAFQKAYQDQLRAFYDRLRDATVSTSWGGELGERVTRDELAQLSRGWRTASEDEALPPV